MEECRSGWPNEGQALNLQDFSILFYFPSSELTPWSLDSKLGLGKCFPLLAKHITSVPMKGGESVLCE